MVNSSIPFSAGEPIVVQTPSDWQHIPRYCPNIPQGLNPLNDQEVVDWVDAISPIETSDIQAVEAGMRRLLQKNAARRLGTRRFLAVSGVSTLGKSVSAVTAMLRIHDDLITEPPVNENGIFASHFPVVYITDQGGSFGNLLSSIGKFISMPMAPNATANNLLRQLRQILPVVGTRLVVVDDAHLLRRVGASRGLTDDLKRLLDAIPVSFVFVGAGLQDSSLLKDSGPDNEYSAALQLRNRMDPILLKPLNTTSSDRIAWQNRVKKILIEIQKVEGRDWTPLWDPTFAANLYEFSNGSTGQAFELLKETVTSAVIQGCTPDADALLKAYKKRGLF